MPRDKAVQAQGVHSNTFTILGYQTGKTVWIAMATMKNNFPLLEDDNSSWTGRAGQEKDLQWKKN